MAERRDRAPSSSAPGSAARVHVPALRAAGFDVVALVGRDAERTSAARRRGSACRAASRRSPTRSRCRASTRSRSRRRPTRTRRSRSRRRAAGRHVLCEKPFALDAAEAEAMLDAAASRRCRAPRRPRVPLGAATARPSARAIADGAIGEPRLATLRVSTCRSSPTRTPRCRRGGSTPRRGGGWLGASGSHVVDQVRTWLGEFVEVSATLSTSCRHAPASPRTRSRSASACASGVDGVLQQTAAAWGPVTRASPRSRAPTARCGSTATSAWIADRDGAAPARGARRSRAPAAAGRAATTLATATRTSSSVRTPGCARRCAPRSTAVPPSAAVPVPTFADGLAEMRVLDAIRASAARGGGASSRVGCSSDDRAATRRCRSARGGCARRTARGAAGRAGGPGSRAGRPRPGDDVLGEPEQRAQLAGERGRDRRERAPSPSAVAASSRFCTAGKIDDGDRRLEAALECRRTRRRAPARPRCRRSRPRSTSASSSGVSRRLRERAPAALPTPGAVRSPIAARVAASRTTTNSHGWRFSALGAQRRRRRARARRLVVGHGSSRERAARALAARRRRRTSASLTPASLARRRARTS